MNFFKELPAEQWTSWWQEFLPAYAITPYVPQKHQDLMDWKMELYDAPLLEWIYRTRLPARHLEFGTWQGFGTRLCLQSCNATVWTINLWEGESKEDGSWAYGEKFDENPIGSEVAQKEGFQVETGVDTYYRTDALGFIGRYYREANLSHRVCQIYCDSQKWDTTNYPKGFFDTVFIDGGHTPEVVISDTRKALEVTDQGALFMWHDFCPVPEVREAYSTPRGVFDGLTSMKDELQKHFSTLVWVRPSWLLIGLRR